MKAAIMYEASIIPCDLGVRPKSLSMRVTSVTQAAYEISHLDLEENILPKSDKKTRAWQ
jgi:hypothetical protein